MIGKKLRRMAAIVLSTVMAATTTQLCAINTAWAETHYDAGYEITCDDSSGYEYDSDNGVLIITGGGEYNLTPQTAGNDGKPIKVTSDEDVTITLTGVRISSNAKMAPFEINAKGDVTVKLAADSRDGGRAENVLEISGYNGSYRYAALQKTSTENELIITSASGDGSTDGILKASGDMINDESGNSVNGGAGIGGIFDSSAQTGGEGKNITINGGTITATGGKGSAGIGGGKYANGSNITINGGNVTATGGLWAAGIGGGETGDGTDITINDGIVTATVARYGAGIGGGFNGNGSNITISGGTVTATGGDRAANDSKGGGAAGIGGGQRGDGSNITISGGTVTAQSGEYGIAGVGAGAGEYNKSAGTSSNIYISPASQQLISVQYSESGTKCYYSKQTDVSATSGNNAYFKSKLFGTLTLPSTTIIDNDSNGGTLITDGDDNEVISGDLSNIDIDATSVTDLTIKGGEVGTITPSDTTAVKVSGAPKCSIDMANIQGGKLTVNGYLTSTNGDIKLLNCTADAVIADISDSDYAQINGSYSAGYAFSASDADEKALALETTTTAITAKTLGTYTLSCSAEDASGNTVTDVNAGDTFNLKVNLAGEGQNVGSAQFTLAADNYTVSGIDVPTGATYSASTDKKQIAITGLNFTASSTPTTVATLTVTANTNISDSASDTIGFSGSSNFITATNSNIDVTPATAGCSVTTHNITVTLNVGNTVFNGNSTTTAITAYTKYKEAGLYSDEERTTEFTMPTVTAADGYRLAKQTTDEPLWKGSDDSTFINNDAVTAYEFEEPAVLTAQAIKEYTVTINNTEDSTKGTITGTGEFTYDAGTTLAEVVKEVTLKAADGTYAITGWKIESDGTTVTDTSKYKLTCDITITPIVGVIEHTIDSIVQTNAAVHGISDGDSVPYGKDVSFVVTATEGCRVYSVQYAVGDNWTTLSYNADGLYTIPGTEITDDIKIDVSAEWYSKIHVQADTGSVMGSADYYAWSGDAGLYTSLDGLGLSEYAVTEKMLKGDLAAEDGYRLASDTVDEPLWSDGTTGYTTTAVLGYGFPVGDTTLKANAIKTWKVTFTAGKNGSLAEGATSTYLIDNGKTLTEVPGVSPNTNYVFDKWTVDGTDYKTDDDLKALAISEDTAVTAEFTPASYSVTFTANDLADFTDKTGLNDDGKGTYLADITFKLDVNDVDGKQIDYVYYTVGTDSTQNVLTPESDVYTIPGGSITGAIAVSIAAEDVRTISFVSADSTEGTVSGTTSFVIADNTSLTEDQFKAVVTTANSGYTFLSWATSEGVVVTEDDILGESSADDVQYKAMFTDAAYTLTDDNSIIDAVSGVDTDDEGAYSVTHGTDVVFTVTAPVTEIGYTVGDGEKTALTADSDGKYTIPGDKLVGSIAIYSTVAKKTGDDGTESDSSFTFITKEEYIGDNINAFANGRKIAVLSTDKLASGNYALSSGSEFFYSESMGGYVIFVDDTETAESLNTKLRINAGSSIKIIDYNGDINRSGSVTAGDAGMLSDILGNKWTQVVTDEQLLMLDTLDDSGHKYVYTSDINDILQKAVDAMN